MPPIENLTWMDHALIGIMAIVLPIAGHRGFSRLRRLLEAGRREALMAEYVQTMVHLWALTAAIMGLWIVLGRPLASLGLAVRATPGFWWTCLLTIGLLGLLGLQLRLVCRKPAFREKARKQIEDSGLSALIPLSPAERRAFIGLSLSAGICEELAYRGFLMAYLSAYVPVFGAIAGSALLFGIGHAYQGPGGMLKTGLFGAALAGLYASSGSLLAVVVLHAANDAVSGVAARLALHSGEPSEDPCPGPEL